METEQVIPPKGLAVWWVDSEDNSWIGTATGRHPLNSQIVLVMLSNGRQVQVRSHKLTLI